MIVLIIVRLLSISHSCVSYSVFIRCVLQIVSSSVSNVGYLLLLCACLLAFPREQI